MVLAGIPCERDDYYDADVLAEEEDMGGGGSGIQSLGGLSK